ncbi:MAG: hypothetical protein R3C52_06650 [Hyphomonadaceae bacterium]
MTSRDKDTRSAFVEAGVYAVVAALICLAIGAVAAMTETTRVSVPAPAYMSQAATQPAGGQR